MGPEVLGYSINGACDAIPCGRTKLYQLIADGRLKAKKLDNKTIITRDSLQRLVDTLPDAAMGRPAKEGGAEAAP